MLMGHPPPIIARGQGAMAVIRRVDGKKDARSVEGVHLKEGVSKVLICYPQYEDERQRNSNTRECFHGSSSAALLLLSRHGYCAPWHDAARQATVSLSAVPRRARAHISPGI